MSTNDCNYMIMLRYGHPVSVFVSLGGFQGHSGGVRPTFWGNICNLAPSAGEECSPQVEGVYHILYLPCLLSTVTKTTYQEYIVYV